MRTEKLRNVCIWTFGNKEQNQIKCKSLGSSCAIPNRGDVEKGMIL